MRPIKGEELELRDILWGEWGTFPVNMMDKSKKTLYASVWTAEAAAAGAVMT